MEGRTLGQVAYEAHRAASGNYSTITGKFIPYWEDISPGLQKRWEFIANEVKEFLDEHSE